MTLRAASWLAGALCALALAGCGTAGPRGGAPVDERGGQAAGAQGVPVGGSSRGEPERGRVGDGSAPAAPLPGRTVVARSRESTVYRLGGGPDATPAPLPEPVSVQGEAVNPAVIELVNAASDHQRGGRLDAAAAALERALKIEPEGAWLWHRLARVRLAQGEPARAEAVAARSSALAADDPGLRADNWRLIAEARRLRGDAGGVDKALAESARLDTRSGRR